VRVLLDEQLPRQLARELTGHDVRTVRQQNWAGLKNGELLRRAADDKFDVLVTADQNLEFQQNLAGSRLGVIVLVAPSNALEDLLPLVPKLLAAIPTTERGTVVRVNGRDDR
jgi:predicted nuclease of predicted toxin-antitoxin system